MSKMHFFSSLRGNVKTHITCMSHKQPLKHFLRMFRKSVNKADGGMNLLAPKINCQTVETNGAYPPTTIAKSLLFAAGFCGVSFIGASVWNFENNKSGFNNNNNITDWVISKWDKMEGYEHKQGDIRKQLNRWWNNESDGRKIFWGICAANVFVFICWRFTPLQGTMMKYFCCSPVGKAVCWPMFLSTFSHYAPLHLAMNMYVLHSFSAATGASLGKEQFLAFYLSGGVFSSFISHFFKLTTQSLGPSLGASGAIMALLGYFCTKYPDAKLGIVFLPNFPFSAESALKAVMLLDMSGIIFRWKFFDHAAHLGGAVFGLIYALYGQSLIWENRSSITKIWDEVSTRYLDKRKDR